MRDLFPEYYAPSRDELRRFFTEGHVVLDANILLGLYRFSAGQRTQVTSVLGRIGERLWVPYQVALEFQRTRRSVISEQTGKFERLRSLPGTKTADDMMRSLGGLKLDDNIVAEVAEHLNALAKKQTEAAEGFLATIHEVASRHWAQVDADNDPIRETLDALLAQRVGQRPSDEVRAERVAAFKKRAEKKIPPGHEDEGKTDPERAAGDYLVWSELLDYAQTVQSDGAPFLFVTSDVKSDWFEHQDRAVVGPRPELIREFASRNGNGYWQLTLDQFLEHATEFLETDVDKATITKASDLWHDVLSQRVDYSWTTSELGRKLAEDLLARRGNEPLIDLAAGKSEFLTDHFARLLRDSTSDRPSYREAAQIWSEMQRRRDAAAFEELLRGVAEHEETIEDEEEES